jgi:hypothetical protein
MTQIGGRQFHIDSEEASLSGFTFEEGLRANAYLGANFLMEEVGDKVSYLYHIEQFDEAENFIGGEQFVYHRDERELFYAQAGSGQQVNQGQAFRLTTPSIGEAATYKWYDQSGKLIYSGRDTTFVPSSTSRYTLEVTAASDGYKDYDTTTVTVKEYYLKAIHPNPLGSQTQLSVQYEASKATSAYLRLSNNTQNLQWHYLINPSVNSITINTGNLKAGTYELSLICDGIIRDSKTLIKN